MSGVFVLPEPERDCPPPCGRVTRAMKLAVVDPSDRDDELVAYCVRIRGVALRSQKLRALILEVNGLRKSWRARLPSVASGAQSRRTRKSSALSHAMCPQTGSDSPPSTAEGMVRKRVVEHADYAALSGNFESGQCTVPACNNHALIPKREVRRRCSKPGLLASGRSSSETEGTALQQNYREMVARFVGIPRRDATKLCLDLCLKLTEKGKGIFGIDHR
jgi:hypothetical protein